MVKYRHDLNVIINTDLPVAELGCAEGYFSRDILEWGIPLLYMIDNWGTIPGARGDGGYSTEWHEKNFKAAMERVKPYNVKVLRGLTVYMAKHVPDNSLGLLYLDAGHSFEDVTADLNAWFGKVVSGGIIAGHDYLNKSYGVEKAVTQFCKGKYIVNVLSENKDEDAGFWFKKILH